MGGGGRGACSFVPSHLPRYGRHVALGIYTDLVGKTLLYIFEVYVYNALDVVYIG